MGKMSDIAIEADELVAEGYSRKEANRIAMGRALKRVQAQASKNNKKERDSNGNNVQK